MDVDFVEWVVGQGVAIAVLAFVLVRLETRLTDVSLKLQQLIDVVTRNAANER